MLRLILPALIALSTLAASAAPSLTEANPPGLAEAIAEGADLEIPSAYKALQGFVDDPWCHKKALSQTEVARIRDAAEPQP